MMMMRTKVKMMTEYNLPPRPPTPPKAAGSRPAAQQSQQAKPKRNKRTNRTIFPVAVASVLAFLMVGSFLGQQVASGKDPRIGSAKIAKVEPQQVLVKKKIITRRVVTIVRDKAPSSTVTAAAQTYNAPAQTYSAPAQTYSAPVQSSPAPVQTATS